MSSRRVTHAKNATQHLGILDITPKKKHHTAAEVAAERQAKLDAKQEKERTKKASIKRVATYEKKQADQDVVSKATPRAAPSKLKSKPIPGKKKAIVAPPAVEEDTSLSDAKMSDAPVAPSVPRPRLKPIPRKKKVVVDAPAAEDNGFLSDAEMDDAAADSSTFKPDLTQASNTMTLDSHADGSDSAVPLSLPREKAKISRKKAGKVSKSSVRDAIKAVQQANTSEKSKYADTKKTTPCSAISLHTDDSDDSDDSDVLVLDPTPKKASRQKPAAVQPDDNAMIVDQPSMKTSAKATSKKSAKSVPAAHLDDDLHEPMITNPPPEKQPSQWAMPILSDDECNTTPMARAPGHVDQKGKGKAKKEKAKEKAKKEKEKANGDQAEGDQAAGTDKAHSDKKQGSAKFKKSSMFKNSTSSRRLPPLTNASTRSSTNSVLTENVLISHIVPIKRELKERHTLQLLNEGLSDEDETQGLEREAAVASPPKGKKNEFQALVKNLPVKPAACQAERTKKPGNNDLPDGVEQKLWCCVFVSTYMQYVATLANPWEVLPKLVCQKMQVIWDAIFPSILCTVMSMSTVYIVTVQRVADSYRSFIGSVAIAIIIAYLESQDKLKDSDNNRVEFAKYTLDKLRFLYKKANGDDKSKFRGLYQGAFVVQTFGAHFTAINGARKVERALTLVTTCTLTISMVLAAKGKSIPLPKALNHSTSKVSNRQTGFNDVTWGISTCSYAKSLVKRFRDEKFQSVITSAKEFFKKSHRSGDDRAIDDAVAEDEDLDECAQLVDISESESGSKDHDDSDSMEVE
ncbi:hypothetical protein DFJ58DRAFT_734231 [Suillus subalutaceus]|uniref:uncharacterized protein n=1 Tax=Suillus subalutaceus TaxID=48586 RepID=UPI001B86B49A|nr:uncharacterized protein DFJ58DRAFT_734231 [Suillus subalutaceus]KAG1837629.1 hypothetical protein DFJ58DRAFT_734231 [Suillus subalutaceus]